MPRTALLAQSAALITRFRSLVPVSEADMVFLLNHLGPPERHANGAELLREGEIIANPRYILSGWALRTRYLSDGRRQIFGFVLPGDAIGLCERDRPLAATNIIACTPVTLCDATAVRSVCLGVSGGFPQITHAHQLANALDEVYLLNQIIRIGRQTAYERLVHLILELHARCLMAGLCDETSFEMPLTQEMLADTLGLSIVHVNRTLQALRREQLIEQRSALVTLKDRARLMAISEYVEPAVAAEKSRR
ncbi:MAG: Crp/Fnr family transcriptional regulator [Pseudomonadota bacterium]